MYFIIICFNLYTCCAAVSERRLYSVSARVGECSIESSVTKSKIK